MSESLMDRVRAEAEAAEAEEETPELEPEPEGEPEPEPEPPSDEAMEKLYRAVESKAANYSKAQAKALAETGLPWQPCPCCGVAGFVLPFNAADPDEHERRLAVLDYFDASEPDYQEANDRAACAACAGWGMVLSGSKSPQHRVVPCSSCNGTGYTVRISGLGTNGTTAPPPDVSGAVAALTGEASVQPDFWGRPPGHRDYGVLPSMVNA